MSYFQNLPLELTEAILDYLDVADFRKTLRTAKFLRHPSEKRLYHRVALPTDLNTAKGLGKIHARFLETIVQSEHLAQHVIELVVGGVNPPEGGNPDINRVIGDAMKKMINLKKLNIYGNPYIAHAHLDSIPFSLTHLVISTQIYADEVPVPNLLPILRAHPDLQELALDCSDFCSELVAALRAEQKGLAPESEIICPKLKRFDGYDEGLLLFLPMRRIESATSLGPGAGWFDDEGRSGNARWLNPLLIQSLQHLRVLEIWPKREWNDPIHSFPHYAPYLTSLTHIQVVDDIRALNHGVDVILTALGHIKTLESVTLASGGIQGLSMMDVRDAVRNVCDVLPDITEVFVGIDEKDLMYYRYFKGEGIQTDLVDQSVACWPYTRWLRE